MSVIWLALWVSPLLAMSNGEYLARVGGCFHCHSEKWEQPMAGGRRLVTPFGDFFTPNITPDQETGIGNWTEADFQQAMDGMARDGLPYYPVFPYRTYTNMTARDRADIFRYLKSLPPVRKERSPNEVRFPYDRRQLLGIWQLLYSGGGMKLATRGAYLVEAVAHCTECHTPRDSWGGPKKDFWMAGSNSRVDGLLVPNITPDSRSGLGHWTKLDWERFLASGVKPTGQTVGGDMAWVIFGTAVMTVKDRLAVVEYMMALKPVYNRVEGP